VVEEEGVGEEEEIGGFGLGRAPPEGRPESNILIGGGKKRERTLTNINLLNTRV